VRKQKSGVAVQGLAVAPEPEEQHGYGAGGGRRVNPS
jgi:hypothetical protein